MNRLSKQEFILGFFSTILLTFKLGWWGLLLACITSVLWPLGGTYWKPIRRCGVPLAVLLFTQNWWCLLGFFPLLIGDGFPDHRTTTKDEGSWLGRQVEKVWPDDKVSGILTKVLVVIILQAAWLPILLK